MKYASGALTALLNASGVILMADLYTLSIKGGSTYRWTSCGRDVVVGGNTFTSATDQGGTPLIKRGSIRCARGLEVDQLDVTFYTGDTVAIGGTAMALAAHNGLLDGARLQVERLLTDNWTDTSRGTVVLFEGEVAGVDPSSTMTAIHVKSDLEKHNIQMPHIIFQPSCGNSFGDPACGINLATLTDTGAAGTGTNASQVNVGTAHADGYYNLGVIQMTSGAALGSRRPVKSYVGGIVTPTIPFSSTPAPGDTFSIYPGCARTQSSCTGYGNLTRFRGMPYVPVPETTR